MRAGWREALETSRAFKVYFLCHALFVMHNGQAQAVCRIIGLSLEILSRDNFPKSAQFSPFQMHAIAKPMAEVGKARPLQGLATQRCVKSVQRSRAVTEDSRRGQTYL